jgi:DNA modification methylase
VQNQSQIESLSRLAEVDWDFAGDKSDSPFSDLHFHPGRFVPQIPAALVASLTERGELVLDPYCGAGTTLVEAQRLGRRVIGIDLNPVSCLVSRAKTLADRSVDIERELYEALADLTGYRMRAIQSTGLLPPIPRSVQADKWYHAETAAELRRIWGYIQTVVGPRTRDLLAFCFSASLMACCAETRTWGYVCDNVRPLERRFVDAYSVFMDRIEGLVDAYRRRDRRLASLTKNHLPEVVVSCGDAAQSVGHLPSESVDLVITSPPYFGVVDYVKAQRLSFEWFETDIEPIRLQETGARSKRHRAQALEDYAQEMRQLIAQVHRVLKTRRAFAVVIGESSHRQPATESFQQLLSEGGFDVHLAVQRQIGLRRRQPAYLRSELIIVATKA